ncbi:MAG: hypothetical protein PF572_06170 [Patescibacteria group bacterium]|jgi:hypothetical protein|nr:hypothetical protein [Patescibacteria group bacterium]
MNHEHKEGQCSQCGAKIEEQAKEKSHRNVFNADFLFILITGVVLNVYALTYTYALFG